jgi:gluconate 5-dehydrogenase
MSPSLFDLTGKTALVIGSSRGLGRAFAEGLAGAGARVVLKLELDTSDWKRVIDTNFTAYFLIGREAARRMAYRGTGQILNIGSLTLELARTMLAPCTASKGGIKMLTTNAQMR